MENVSNIREVEKIILFKDKQEVHFLDGSYVVYRHPSEIQEKINEYLPIMSDRLSSLWDSLCKMIK